MTGTLPSVQPVEPRLGRRNTVVALVLLVVIATATGALLFGPARGARDDIGHVRQDLHASRVDIGRTLTTTRRTLARSTATLRELERSLAVQRQGLAIATQSQRLARTTADNTSALLRQTTDTLRAVRQILPTLDSLRALPGRTVQILDSVRTGVRLAQGTQALAQQTLSTGRAALQVATKTLSTLRRSYEVQAALLRVGRRTLDEVRQINGKLPLPVLVPNDDAPAGG